MISKILLEKIISCVDESNKGECWLCNNGSQMRITFEISADEICIMQRNVKSVVVNKYDGEIIFENNSEILRLLCSHSTEIK